MSVVPVVTGALDAVKTSHQKTGKVASTDPKNNFTDLYPEQFKEWLGYCAELSSSRISGGPAFEMMWNHPSRRIGRAPGVYLYIDTSDSNEL